MKFLLVLIVSCQYLIARSAEVPLFTECVEYENDTFCLNVTQQNCAKLSSHVFVNGVSVIGPTSISVLQVINQIQQSGLKQCFPLVVSTCNLCVELENISFVQSSLKSNGSLSLECEGESVSRVKIQSIEVQNCSLFNCGGNQCSGNGDCSDLHVCKCRGQTVGFDCGIEQKKNCITGNIFKSGDLCLEGSAVCDELAVTVKSDKKIPGIKQKLMDLHMVPLDACTNNFKPECFTCPYINFYLDNSTVFACPSVSLVCNNFPQATYNLTCFPIANVTDCPPILMPESPQNHTQENPKKDDPLQNVVAFVFSLSTILLIGTAFFIYKTKSFLMRRFGRNNKSPEYISSFGEVQKNQEEDEELSDVDEEKIE